MTDIPLSLYVHLPWCVRKCPYCDFNSHRAPDELPEAAYVEALAEDLEEDASWASGRAVKTVFFGGGTPSLFAPAAIAEILDAAASRLTFADEVEVTLEANPGTVEHAPWAELKAAGINRISLGVQSLDARKLKVLGRVHGPREALQAIGDLRKAGFENFNVDLMYGLPDQSISDMLGDLKAVLSLEVPHVSHYQLTLEPNTLFAARPPAHLPGDDRLWAMQEAAQELLAVHGYEHYEVSAYAQTGHRCSHNLNYWLFGDYLGIGAGAHGKITTGREVWRTTKQRHPKHFMTPTVNQPRRLESRRIDQSDLLFEFALNALRLVDGFPVQTLQERTGLSFDRATSPWNGLIDDGLVEVDQAMVRCSARGRQYLNEVLMRFLPD